MVSDKQNIIFIPQKRILWILLVLLFTFDDVISYWAIKYMHGKEANLLIAPLVEKYPILYFPLIPFTFVLMIIIAKVILIIAEKVIGKWVDNNELLERVILLGLVVYWIIGNSLPNLIFFLGYRIPGIWTKTSMIALPIALIYVLFIFYQILKLRRVK